MKNDKRLTNLFISENYNDLIMWLMRKDFTGPFAKWVIQQSPYDMPLITEPMMAFNDYISTVMVGETCKEFSYDEVSTIIHEDKFEGIPAIVALNVPRVSSGLGYQNRHEIMHPDYDFIDLSALARNVFYSIMRSHITNSDELNREAQVAVA